MPYCIVQNHGKLMKLVKDDRGQGLLEYAIILMFIVFVLVAAVKMIGNTTNNSYNTFNSAFTNH
jgi:pilus assembly protein Flp/PilA